ncbi:MAG: hypothetical protein WDZ77_01295 [Candidatus Pacearchaeota archaeon]
MPTQSTIEIKEKILSTFANKGPCLPVEIAKETGQSILFASAFLSEFLSEKKIKISNMKVGGSPLYLLPGQEYKLEKFSEYLKSKEKDAFLFLKEKKILKDSEQEPAIRVALRSIKDFAFPFKKDDEIYWRYLTFSEEEVKNSFKEEKKIPGNEEVSEKEQSEEKAKKKVIRTKVKKTAKSKKNEKFFEEVKNFIKGKGFELEEIVGFSNKELCLLIRKDLDRKILIAFDKKRISEKDIVNSSKKAKELNLTYIILSKGGVLKKTNDLIEGVKNLDSLERI